MEAVVASAVSNMLNITGLHVSVPVLDMDSAVEFYVDVLGLDIIDRSDDLSQLYIGLNRISLKKVEHESTSLQADGYGRIRARHFGFCVGSPAEVDEIESRLRERNCRIVMGVSERPDARTMFCCDPNGNQIEIYYDRLAGIVK
jgi:catechol-2,3-dioxygenase